MSAQGSASGHEHQPVLLAPTLSALALRPAGSYLDCTFGRGGHTKAILEQLGQAGRVFGLDRDPEAVKAGESLQQRDSRFQIIRGRHEQLGSLLSDKLEAEGLDGALFDLGLSSPQLDDPERGFSFNEQGPLDMRMDPDSGISAAQWLNHAGEKEIADVIYEYGQERLSRRIARAIVNARPLSTTTELAELVRRQYPRRYHRIHPATRTFQAIRIRVNEELSGLHSALSQALELLRVGGRLVVISFHSLEDRIVKLFMREHRGTRLQIIERLLRPSEEECRSNRRARSARLRVSEKIA